LFKIFEFIRKKRLRMLNKIILMFVFAVIYFSILIVNVEQTTNPQLQNFQDGIWLTVTTITSVGYGDVTPTTYLGKIVAIFLMVFGIGISSAIGALFVSWLLKPTQDKIYLREAEIEKEEQKLTLNEKKLENLEKNILNKIETIQKDVDEIKNR